MSVKPALWNVNPAEVDSRFRSLWRDIAFCVPLLEGDGSPREIVTGRLADTTTGRLWTPREPGATLERTTAGGGGTTVWTDVPEASPAFIQQDTDPEFTFFIYHYLIADGGNYVPFRSEFPNNVDGAWQVIVDTLSADDWRIHFNENGTSYRVFQDDHFATYGDWRALTWTRSKTNTYRVYDQGVFVSEDTTQTQAWDTANSHDIQLLLSPQGWLAFVALWNRVLSDDEIRLISADPFGMVRQEAVVDVDFVHQFFPVKALAGSLPADFFSALAGTLHVRARGVNTAGTIKLYAQIFRSDETTPLSDEVLAVAVSTDGAFTNYSVPFTGIVPSTLAVWENATVRFRWSSI